MSQSSDDKQTSVAPRARRPGAWKWALLGLLLLAAAAAMSLHLRREHLASRLLAVPPDAAASDPSLVRFAVAQARPLYARYCSSCHGADMRGNPALGAPNLTDSVWLYGDGSVHEIELTVLYGVRSGVGKAHNVTDMPAYGLTGRLREGEIRDVVQYVLELAGRPYQVAAANEGRTLYAGVPNCADCHGFDGRGNSNYGAPDLTANVWNSGGDPQALFNDIYYGEHRMMPAWIDTLSLMQIRALAVYIHTVAQPSRTAASGY